MQRARAVLAAPLAASLAACASTTTPPAPATGAPPPASAPPARAADPGERLAAFFTPPPGGGEPGGGLHPVAAFADGRPVRAAAEWRERRRQLLAEWHEMLGPWPPLIEKPASDQLWKQPVVGEGFVRHRLDVEVAPGRKAAAFLLVPDGPGPFPAVVDVFYYPEDCAGLKPDRRAQNDFGYQLVRRGFVALCLGQFPSPPRPNADLYFPTWDRAQLQPLSYLAYVAANMHTLLAQRPEVDPARIGIVGHSYGGKWSLFAGALHEKFAAVCVSDPGIVFDEKRPSVNYWEPWYLGYVPGTEFRPRGVLTETHPRVGPYKALVEAGRDLHELHALIAPRPFFVAGGSEDPPERWNALAHTVALNRLLGHERRVGMANRPAHKISPEASEQIALFFEHALGKPAPRAAGARASGAR